MTQSDVAAIKTFRCVLNGFENYFQTCRRDPSSYEQVKTKWRRS